MFNEQSLKRLDLILSEASANGVRIILPFVNFWPDLGGMQWYVDQVGKLQLVDISDTLQFWTFSVLQILM